jgi:glycosyltransferase involved in cell wall biosynthesis
MSQHRRHILIMSSWYPNRLDQFVGNFVQRFAELLARDHDVSVIHTLGDRSNKSLEIVDQKENGVRVVRAYHPVSKNKIRHWWNQRKALRACFSLIEDIDLIFAHVLLPRGYQFTAAKKYYHRDLIVLEHASYYRPEVSKRISSLNKQMMKRVSRHVEQFCAVSELLANDMKNVLPTVKPVIVPNFVDAELFHPASQAAEHRRRFLHISTLDSMTKNPELLFEGFYAAYQSNKHISLTVISDQNTNQWQNWADVHGLSNAVTWIGPSSWEEIAEQMRNHDCVIMTSGYETFNIVLAEAWCSGIPVISTSVGIARELDPSLGIQLKEANVPDLVNAIETITSGALKFNPKIIREHGLQFSKEKVLEQLKELFEPHFKAYE